MMKDWGIARQRVQELKSIDPKASEKLNKEVTNVSARFWGILNKLSSLCVNELVKFYFNLMNLNFYCMLIR